MANLRQLNVNGISLPQTYKSSFKCLFYLMLL